MSKAKDLNQTRRNLANYDDEQLINAAELAALLSTTGAMIYRYLYKSPGAIPGPMPGFGRKRVWHLGSCRRWLRERASAGTVQPSSAPAPKRTGRPRSTDSVSATPR